MPSPFDVIVLGSYSIDLIFSGLDEFPSLGKDTVAKNFYRTPGEAYIPAITLHRLGLKVGWAGDFGNDEYSQQALKLAREEGLDDSLFIVHNQPYRRISVAASLMHDRGFLTYYDPEPSQPAGLQAITKSQTKIVLLPALFYGPLFDIGIKLTQIKRMKVVMDGNSTNGNIHESTKESMAIRNAIKSVDIFLPNAQEASRITGEANIEYAIRKLGELCPLVVIKDGPNGSYAFSHNELIHVRGIPIDPVDTTGAGDNFNSGFLCAWLNGEPLYTCLKWGNITGGISTMDLGGTSCFIDRERVQSELLKFYP